MKIYTIGHSAHPQEKFLQLLSNNEIKTLVDVRTMPASRFQPQFNKENLEYFLPKQYIQYVFAGKFLGGRPSDPSCYKKRTLPSEGANYLHEVDYPEVMKKSWFLKGIDRLLKLAEEQITTVMCSEEDPALCHRHHLIAKFIMYEFPEIEVMHIRGDGTIFNASTLLTSVKTEPVQQLSFF
jgi:uncharacterized protein (DUF488 family)